MPELPEVETTRRGISKHVEQQTVKEVIIRQARLRWPIPAKLKNILPNQIIHTVTRRAKYLILSSEVGYVIIHLGMSGSLRVLDAKTPAEKHDHIDFVFSNGKCLRLRDPRRFGAVLFTRNDPAQHKLLKSLGPEPLSNSFTATYLVEKSRKRKLTIKSFIMDSKIVVGVGNIYASEALFRAGVHPKRAAGKVTKEKYSLLTTAIKEVLTEAIKAGGTSLRDFTQSDGKPGYFKQALKVYGRKGEPCNNCKKSITQAMIAQRSTFYCTHCQK